MLIHNKIIDVIQKNYPNITDITTTTDIIKCKNNDKKLACASQEEEENTTITLKCANPTDICVYLNESHEKNEFSNTKNYYYYSYLSSSLLVAAALMKKIFLTSIFYKFLVCKTQLFICDIEYRNESRKTCLNSIYSKMHDHEMTVKL